MRTLRCKKCFKQLACQLWGLDIVGVQGARCIPAGLVAALPGGALIEVAVPMAQATAVKETTASVVLRLSKDGRTVKHRLDAKTATALSNALIAQAEKAQFKAARKRG